MDAHDAQGEDRREQRHVNSAGGDAQAGEWRGEYHQRDKPDERSGHDQQQRHRERTSHGDDVLEHRRLMKDVSIGEARRADHSEQAQRDHRDATDPWGEKLHRDAVLVARAAAQNQQLERDESRDDGAYDRVQRRARRNFGTEARGLDFEYAGCAGGIPLGELGLKRLLLTKDRGVLRLK